MSNARTHKRGVKKAAEQAQPPVLVLYDDLPAIARDPDLPKTLAQSTGQDMVIGSIHHDDSQLEAAFGIEGRNMATTFGVQVVSRGIGCKTTLERLSMYTGQHFVTVRSKTSGRNSGTFFGSGPTKSSGETSTPQVMPVLTPAEINQGHPAAPNINQTFHSNRWQWTYQMQYYENPLIVKALVKNMAFLATLPPQRLHLLRHPDLDRYGDTTNLGMAGGDDLIATYRQAIADIKEKAARYREMQAAWAQSPSMRDYDDSRSPVLMSNATLVVAIQEPANGRSLQEVLRDAGKWTRKAGATGWTVEEPFVEPVAVEVLERGSAKFTSDDLWPLVVALDGPPALMLRLTPVDRPSLHFAWSLVQRVAKHWPLVAKDVAGVLTHLGPPPDGGAAEDSTQLSA